MTASAERLDRDDPLAALRDLFALPEGVVYLDGNSLGAMPKAVAAEMRVAVDEEWAGDLIAGWTKDGWWRLPETLGDLAGGIVGAAPGQTVVSDGTSINLHKALWAALDARPGRHVMVAEAQSFPADLYIAEALSAARAGVELRYLAEGEPLATVLSDDVAAVLLSHVDYRTGALRDMAPETAMVHDAGALMVWDLCHSAGVVPVALDACEVDFAVGCTYKYLNGGPGAPAFIYVAARLHEAARQPLSGWWAHAAPFDFERRFRADRGIRKFLCGTQPVLSLRALKPALELYAAVDLAAVRHKSMALTQLFIDQVEARCAGHGLELLSPRDAERRGSQVSFTHPDGFAIVQALIARGVVGDFRAPDVMRFGFSPLYLRYRDVVDAAAALQDVLATEAWRAPEFQARGPVT